MMLSCCAPGGWEPQKDKNLENNKAQKNFCDFSTKNLQDDLDVVDNPNASITVSYESKDLFETMKCEKNRWDSFDKKWPLPFINISELVECGFFYLQSDDKVQCAFCKLILRSWKVGDKPLKEHIKSSPKCPFVMRVASTSVPQKHFTYLGNSTLSHSNPSKPKNPRMLDLRMRLSTFKSWPHATIKVQDLAECGLYYTGVQDVVTCFYCGGGLSNWEPYDEPIVEHAKFYPNCNYLRIIQSRPVYKRFKSAASNMTIQTGGNLSSNQLEAKEFLKSDIVQKAKEIFPSSMVERVVVQHLQNGENFSSLHHLCEKVLQQEDTGLNPRVIKMESSNIVEKPTSTSAARFEKVGSTNDIMLCKICMDREREVVFQPCGHLISCEKCAMQITKCPLCRKDIVNRMRTFLS